jgi:NAD(P)-dependent dehydrogenase (short-subunit alcohol dehydrogenase family)
MAKEIGIFNHSASAGRCPSTLRNDLETRHLPTPQTPIHSGFGPASTAAEVIGGIDLSGKTAIVTGGYSGLGRETVRVFRAAGADVIVPARDVSRAGAALKDIAGVEVWPMDLLDPASIDVFAARFLAPGRPLDILVNNAGIMALPELARDARGHELQFATNHLGHFHLAVRLWPALVQAKGARVISVSSMGHRFSPVVFDDIDYERRPYDPWSAYGQSKTANILFAVALDDRGAAQGVRAFAVHPGGILETNLARHLPANAFKDIGAVDAAGKPIVDPARGLKSVEQGAATQVWCAASPRLAGMGGVYCENCEVSPLRNDDPYFDIGKSMGETGVWPYAVDRAAAARLWAVSEAMTGVTFGE